MGPAPPLRVVVAEDDVLMREGLARLLTEAGLDVVGQAKDAPELVGKVLAYQPDVAVVDVRMPPHHELDGLLAAVELRRRLPRLAVLVLSQLYDPALALELIGDRPEGVGYLLKERVGDVETFVEAVRRVAAGGSALDPEVVARLLGRRRPDDRLSQLSTGDRAVLAGMAEGRSNLGIAEELHVSEAAVEKHVTAIFRALDLGADIHEHRRVLAVLTFLAATHEQP